MAATEGLEAHQERQALAMAKDFLGNIIVLGGVAVGGYFIWQWWQAQQVQAAAAPAAGAPGTPTSTAPAYTYTPPTVTAQLQTAGASNSIVHAQGGQADAYQWATIYNGISGLPSISAVNINGTFFPSGLPANQTSLANTAGYSQQGLPLLTAALFIQGLQAAGIKGLSGFGQGPKLIAVPVMLTPTSRHQMQIPAGTTRAELQRRLRAG